MERIGWPDAWTNADHPCVLDLRRRAENLEEAEAVAWAQSGDITQRAAGLLALVRLRPESSLLEIQRQIGMAEGHAWRIFRRMGVAFQPLLAN